MPLPPADTTDSDDITEPPSEPESTAEGAYEPPPDSAYDASADVEYEDEQELSLQPDSTSEGDGGLLEESGSPGLLFDDPPLSNPDPQAGAPDELVPRDREASAASTSTEPTLAAPVTIGDVRAQQSGAAAVVRWDRLLCAVAAVLQSGILLWSAL